MTSCWIWMWDIRLVRCGLGTFFKDDRCMQANQSSGSKGCTIYLLVPASMHVNLQASAAQENLPRPMPTAKVAR